ncbi:MAG: hypothetical protein ACTSXC_03055, partial [Candidatus Freyarchaeota archaeon]
MRGDPERMPEEFVVRLQESRREGKYGDYVTYRVTIPKWLVELYGLKKGDLIRLVFKSKVRG